MLDYIEDHITDEINPAALAERAGYSMYHFSRIFTEAFGISPMSYVVWRRLQYALYDLSRGEKVIDAALKYGFETHGGFTKAFTNWFGFPPSLCYLRLSVSLPAEMSVEILKNKFGGNPMNPHIIELTPFSVVGWPTRHTIPNIKSTAGAPTYWDTIKMDTGMILTKLHDTFTQSKHFEISMCYGINGDTGEFSYMLGKGIDNPEDLARIEPDMTRVDMAGGLYAVVPTPLFDDDSYTQTIQNTWNDVFLNWLPQSEFEFDNTRPDFNYHDYRDHGWYFNGKQQIDICVPIRQREEETRKSQLRASRS